MWSRVLKFGAHVYLYVVFMCPWFCRSVVSCSYIHQYSVLSVPALFQSQCSFCASFFHPVRFTCVHCLLSGSSHSFIATDLLEQHTTTQRRKLQLTGQHWSRQYIFSPTKLMAQNISQKKDTGDGDVTASPSTFMKLLFHMLQVTPCI